ncbi:MAG: nucleotide sugar dehydrogenase [Candidatus Bathyarchaeia archaeon]
MNNETAWNKMSMMMKLAREDIDSPKKREKYTVSVVGCGRTCLSTACLFAEAGFKVIGVDMDQRIVNLMKTGKSSFTEPQLEALIKKHRRGGRFTATTDARNSASTSDIIIFTVPTPVDRRKKPDYSYVEKACREVGMGLRSGSLVIFQSMVGPRITETLVKETLENASGLKAGVDFGLAYYLTRAASEQVLEDVTHAKVVGAINQQSLKVACLVLGTITNGEIVTVRNIRTAEAVKLFENVCLDVNVALANEFARFCEKTGIDFVEVRNAANTQAHSYLQVPGIAGGGHILEGPYLLAAEAEEADVKLRMLMLARKINEEMLTHTLHLARDALRSCGKTLRRAKVSVLGVSSCPNVKESRGSPTKKLVSALRRKGSLVRVYDPLYTHKELLKMGYPAKTTLTKTVEGADCIIIAVGHDRFRRLSLGRIKIFVKNPAAIVDMGHVIDPDKAEKEGFVYRGVGRGVWTK